MTDVHRKIELQEKDDLRYLINNARRQANERIDLALPPIEGEDALRRRVEELVHEVCSISFSSLLARLLIATQNGYTRLD
jgi:kinetochor protein Mis14/NSL1